MQNASREGSLERFQKNLIAFFFPSVTLERNLQLW